MDKDPAGRLADLSTAGGGHAPVCRPHLAAHHTHPEPPAYPPAFVPRAPPFPFLPAHPFSHACCRLISPPSSASLSPSPRLHTSCYHSQQLLWPVAMAPTPRSPRNTLSSEKFPTERLQQKPPLQSAVCCHIFLHRVRVHRVTTQAGSGCPSSP